MKAETTKRNIKNAFLALARNIPVNKISITNLVAHAKISRGTFYTHYDNIQAMLEDIGKDLLHGLDDIWQTPVIHHSILHVLPSSAEHFVQYLEENQDIFRILLGKHGDPSFLMRWISHLQNALSGCLRMEGVLPNTEIEQLLAFVAKHGIHDIRKALVSGQFAEATLHVLAITDSVLHFIAAGHQQVTHIETSREREREQQMTSYLY